MSQAKNPGLAVLKQNNGAEKIGFESETVAAELRRRNERVDSVADLSEQPIAADGRLYQVVGFRPGSQKGGGNFVWRSGYDKAEHDGVQVIDPARPFPADFNNASAVNDWLTPGAGAGCYVKQWNPVLSGYEAGIIDASSATDDQLITALLNSIKTQGARLAILPFELVTVFRTTVNVPKGVALDLHGGSIEFQIEGAVKAFEVQTKSQLYNGTVTVNGTLASGGGDKQAPVSGGEQGTGVGISKAKIHDLTVNTNRSNGNGVVLFGECVDCEVSNITIPDSATIGRCVALEWGGSVAGTGHPHNCTVTNIRAGNLSFGEAQGSNAFVTWLSSAFNITVDNVYADSAYGVLGVFTGDKSNDHAPARYKNLIGRGITASNITCENVKKHGIRCYGKGSDSVNLLPQSVNIINPTLRGDGVNATAIGILCEFTNGVTVNNPDISGMQTGIATGQEAKNLKVHGGKVWNNRASGVSLGSAGGGVIGCGVIGTSLYGNNQGGFAGIGGAAAIFIQNCESWQVNDCRFGSAAGETQQYSVRAENTAPNGTFRGNHTVGLVSGGVAYVNGGSTDYDINTTGDNNTVEPGLAGFGGAPIYSIDWLGRKQFSIAGVTPPSGGSWQQGDRCYYSAPSPGGAVGTVFTSTGVWKDFGQIDA